MNDEAFWALLRSREPTDFSVTSFSSVRRCEPGCDHCAFQAALTAEDRRSLPALNAALARWRAGTP